LRHRALPIRDSAERWLASRTPILANMQNRIELWNANGQHVDG
jgi:hypothetical protein